jgi:hypothetical protein
MKGPKTWQRNLLSSAVAASLLVGASLAGAATTQGTVGSTSTGTVDLHILVPDLVLVNNLDDIVLNYNRGAGDVSVVETFCVWGSPGLEYDITFDSSNPAGSAVFTAVSGTDTVEYTLDFDDWSVGTAFAAVDNGVTMNNGGVGYTAANAAVPGCTSDNAALRVNATEAGNLINAPAGDYTDTLTVTVAPI